MANEKTLAALTVKIGANIEAFQSGLAKAEKRLAKMERNFQRTGEKLTKNITAPLLALGGVAVSQAAKMETLETSFVSMTGSVENAKKMVQELTEFTASTPFNLEGVGASAKILLSFGTQAENVQGTLKTLGDIAAGADIPLQDMAGIFGKIQTKGKAMTEEIMQMAERGIPIIDVLAERFNVSKDAIFEMASKGQISFQMIQESLAGMTSEGGIFFDQMGKQSQTLAGIFSTLKDNVVLALAEMGNDISQTFNLKEVMANAIVHIQALVEHFKAMDPAMKKTIITIAGVVAAIGPALLIFSKIIGVIKGAATAFKVLTAAMASNPFIAIAIAVTALITLIVTLWKRSEKFRAVVKYVAESVAAFFQKAWVQIKQGAELMWLSIKTYFTAIPKAAAAIWKAVKRAMKGEKLGEVLAEEFSNIVANVQENATAIKDKYSEELAAIKTPNYEQILATEKAISAAKEAGEETAKAFNTGMTAGGMGNVQRTPVANIDPMQGQTASVSSIGFGDAFGLEVDKLKSHAERLKKVALDMKTTLEDNFINIGPLIQDSLVSAFNTLGESIGSLAAGQANMSDVFKDMLGVVADFIGKFGQMLIQAGVAKKAFDALINVGGGALAIVAGTALVAMATMVKGHLSGGLSGGSSKSSGNESGGWKNIPALASGGIATRPTLAMIGDSKNSMPNSEAIVPLNKLNNLFGNINVTGRLYGSGRDLYAVIENEKTRLNS